MGRPCIANIYSKGMSMADINMDWVERLRAPRYVWSQIAAHNPQRGILCREQESQQQLLTWDVETGETRALTLPVPYTLNATLSPDGEFVTYLTRHPTHEEVFQYVRVPYAGGTPQPMALTALMYASPHIEEAANARIGFTAVAGNGYSVQVWTPTSTKPLFSFESEVLAYGPALSADGTIAVIATLHSDTSESTHLEAYNIDTGEKISQLELPDTPLEAVKFAPGMGDSRLLVQAREGALTRPLVWDVKSGAVESLNGLKSFITYAVWDWVDDKKLLLSSRRGDEFSLLTYDPGTQSLTQNAMMWGHLFLAYSISRKIFSHYETIHGTVIQTHDIGISQQQGEEGRALFPQVKRPYEAREGAPVSSWHREKTEPGLRQIVGVTFKDEAVPYPQVAAWIEQGITYINASLWEPQIDEAFPIRLYVIQALELAFDTFDALKRPDDPSVLTAQGMAAALALLVLHDSSIEIAGGLATPPPLDSAPIWRGGVMVRPILDWVHLYENVSPPEKAMMRLWFGGSPTDEPHVWRTASPLRQTKPLTVPVKLLYHPHDALTPIQHIQTYAANNPTVELIDISRDLVGPAHQQQERLITRMLEAGLPLLTSP